MCYITIICNIKKIFFSQQGKSSYNATNPWTFSMEGFAMPTNAYATRSGPFSAFRRFLLAPTPRSKSFKTGKLMEKRTEANKKKEL